MRYLLLILLLVFGCDWVETDHCNFPLFSDCPSEECSEDTVCDEGYECVMVLGEEECQEYE